MMCKVWIAGGGLDKRNGSGRKGKYRRGDGL